MPRAALFAFDLIAIAILGFAIYFPRYRRRDLLLSYVVVNVGVMAVSVALAGASVGVGVGFGLFGVLSIVRLRSSELGQQEVAYYFAALALGLLGGMELSPDWLAPTLMAVILGALYVVDHPSLFARSRHQHLVLDRAFTDEAALTRHLEDLLGADLRYLLVKEVDLVRQTTEVDVRYQVRDATAPLDGRHEALDAPVER